MASQPRRMRLAVGGYFLPLHFVIPYISSKTMAVVQTSDVM